MKRLRAHGGHGAAHDQKHQQDDHAEPKMEGHVTVGAWNANDRGPPPPQDQPQQQGEQRWAKVAKAGCGHIAQRVPHSGGQGAVTVRTPGSEEPRAGQSGGQGAPALCLSLSAASGQGQVDGQRGEQDDGHAGR